MTYFSGIDILTSQQYGGVMKALITMIFSLMTLPSMLLAQEVQGPKMKSFFVEGFTINSSPVGMIVTFDYSIQVLQIGQLKMTALGFLDLEPMGERKFYFTNHDQVIKYGIFPAGIIFEEAANRSGEVSRLGLTTNLNDVAIVQLISRRVMKVANVSWLLATSGNIGDEIKIYMNTRDLKLGQIGSVNVEGFYRIRYGIERNFGQPQLVFRPGQSKWFRLVCELEQSSHKLDIYLGARLVIR